MPAVTQSRKNENAPILERYFKKENLNFFHKRILGGEADTVLFITALPAGQYRLLTAVITDNSIYTIVRCRLGNRIPQLPGYDRYLEFLRGLNAAHAFFKYASNEDGDLYLDVCLPAAPAHFDPEMIRTTLNLLVFHLQDTYTEILKWIDKPGDAENDLAL